MTTATSMLLGAFVGLCVVGAVVGGSWLGLLNFVVLQWFGVRLERSFRMVHDIPPGEFAGALEGALHRVLSKAYGSEDADPAPKSYPLRKVPGGWRILRWVWPLTGWWSPYRWIARPR